MIHDRILRVAFLLVSFIFVIVAASGCSPAVDVTYSNPSGSYGDVGYLRVKMPSIPSRGEDSWFNLPGDTLNLRGRIVLIDFWDYTCVNCLRTLPYLESWYSRYAKDGLVIIGVHSPEFQFAGLRKNLSKAISELSIDYPVVMDNDFSIWKEFSNQFWPAEYLFDATGTLRFYHYGEGNYAAMEKAIQILLHEGRAGLSLPEVMSPLRETDQPGAVCYRTTPETYLGFERGTVANAVASGHQSVFNYSLPSEIQADRCYLAGKWVMEHQYVRYAGDSGKGSIVINYVGKETDLVARPIGVDSADSQEVRVDVQQDGKPVPKDDRGRDLIEDASGNTYFTLKASRMYTLINNKDFGRHVLTVIPGSDRFAAYSFTFVTACAVAPEK